MHALLMPDTPGLAALRDRINELATGPALISLARQTLRPQGMAFAIAGCLQPAYSALYESLLELAATGPSLLHAAGDEEHDPERYMATWLSSIRELGERG